MRRPIENVTIGTDPECFVFNTKTNKVKSAVKLIPGTKEHPQSIPELGPGFAIQTDNILAEFNVPPVTNVNDFVKNIDIMKDYLRKFVKNINEDYDILCTASQEVPKNELRSKQAKMFGCDPDYCIYTGTVNPRPAAADTTNIRSCGLHIHCGYDNPEIDRSLRLLAYFDAFLGLPSILIDKDTRRRTLYGKAGCFRLQKWGFEYRSLSAYFMKDDEHLRWVFEQAMKAIDAYNDCWKLPEEVQSVINNNDEDLALKLCEDYNLCSNFLLRMCGLFGIINRNKSLLDKRAFITLGCANDTRGGDACGIMIDRKVDKGTEKNDQYFQIWYSKSALLKSTIRCNVALGHCRKASVGGVTADKAQPIIIKDDEGNIQFCLIHNGTIYNYKELAAKYIPEIKIDDLSDSQVMARIFYYSGYDVLGEYEGSGAFVIQDYRYNKTYMFKGESLGNTTTKNPEVERPLYFVKTGKSIVFSSIYSVLQGLYYELDVYNVPSNVLLECDGKNLYEVKKYDRTKCYHCKRYVTKTYSVINDDYFWEGLKSKTVSPIVDFDVESGLYMNASTGEDLHGVQYVSNYGYIAKYSTGFNKPYYFWYGLMINGEIAYNKLRELDTAKMPAHQLFQIAKRLSCNPTVYNKKYYVYDSSHKRVPFTDNYIFPLTGVEIVCSKKGKVIVVYDNNRIETTLPIELTEEAIDKIVNYVKNSIQ